MNVFLQKDFKNQVDFADNKTKRKLQVFFLRKELQQLKDAKERLFIDIEKEKQEQTHNALAHSNNTQKFIPPMVETPQIQYVNKVLFPQRVKADSINSTVMKPIKNTINIDLNKRNSLLAL